MRKGFTLAELLIALAILGVIAAFSIPKVLQSQQDAKFKAMAKEAASTVAQAYDLYKLSSQPTANTRLSDLTPYLNYVQMDTATRIDHKNTLDYADCSATSPCLKLHNGAVFMYPNVRFDGTATTNALNFMIDPDGIYSGSVNGSGKSVEFYLYFNGRLRTRGTTQPNTVSSGGTVAAPVPSLDPPWFGWD